MAEPVIYCSQCGANMERLKGAYGQFYGCINFPKCRHTMSLASAAKKMIAKVKVGKLIDKKRRQQKKGK